jgi:hypothetical protein
MEKRVSDFKDDVWKGIARPISEKRSIGNCKKIKRKRIEKVDRLDDMRTVGNLCIMLLKFFVLLNILVITSRML